jgi:ABC-type nitrate/sulfonate/bicarbonate transport system permease component
MPASDTVRRALRIATAMALVIVVWWMVAVLFGTRGNIVATPGGTLSQIIDDGWSFYGANIAATLTEALQGFLWGNLIAIALAGATALFPTIKPFVSQLALFAYSIPIIAIGPILVTAFNGRVPMIILSAAAVVFLTLSSVIDGLGMSDKATLDLVDSLGGSRWQRLRYVRWWYALPGLFSGLKLAVPGALLGAIFGEYLGRVDSGLGVVLVRSQKELHIERTWGIILVMVAISATGYFILSLISRRLLRWAKDMVASPSAPDTRLWVNLGGVLGSAVLMLALWWAGLGAAGISDSIARTPLDVLQYLFTDGDADTARSTIGDNVQTTLKDTLGGLVLGIVLAVLCSALATRARWVSDLIVPVAIILRATPMVAVAPVMFVAIGRGYPAVTFLVTLLVFFPAFLILLEGMASAPTELSAIVRAVGGDANAILRFVTLPASIPYLFSALRVTLPNAIMAALIAEWLATGQGLGAALIKDITRFNFDSLWAGVFVATGVSIALYTLVDFLETAYRRHKHLI